MHCDELYVLRIYCTHGPHNFSLYLSYLFLGTRLSYTQDLFAGPMCEITLGGVVQKLFLVYLKRVIGISYDLLLHAYVH